MTIAILSAAGFQIGWLACAYGSLSGLSYVGTLTCLLILGLHLLCRGDRLSLAALSALLGFYGFLAESIVVFSGLIAYASPGPFSSIAPIWIVALWMAFATIVGPSLAWLRGRLILASVLGAVMGPLSYWAAMRIGALQLAEPPWMGLLAIGAMWAIAMPVCIRVQERMTLQAP